MNLSAIAKESDLSLTRSESTLTGAITAPVSADDEERYRLKMRQLARARDALKQMPDKQSMQRQQQADKVQILKQRLTILRQSVPFLSPAAARALMAEMKQIAAQLRSLHIGSADGTTSASAGATEVPESPPGAAAAQTVQDSGQQQTGAKDTESSASQSAAVSDSPLAPVPQNATNSKSGQSNDPVDELNQLYRTVLTALKRKAGERSGSPKHVKQLTAYLVIPGARHRIKSMA